MVQQQKTARPALKICGVRTARDARECLALGVDYVGFNLHPGSKRWITARAAAEAWAKAVADHGDDGTSRPVAIAVDMAPDDVVAAVAQFPALAAVQFHGRETPAELRALAPRLGGRAVWKALTVRTAADVAAAAAFADACALVLFDGGSGGAGQRFDWELVRGHRAAVPFGIAGGLRPGLLAPLAAYAPALVDLCSGVESAPGVKDLELLRAVRREMDAAW